MPMMGFKEALYIKHHLREVKHVTLSPGGSDVLRIHMVPPRRSLNKHIPSVVIVNGQDIVPLNISWAIILSAFIDVITPYDGRDMGEADWDSIVCDTIKRVKSVYPSVNETTIKNDLWTIINTFTDIARGRKPEVDIGQVSLGEYAAHMKAPHRMDLMISSMSKEGSWNCNQKCLHCYAAGQQLAAVEELPTHSWKQIIDKCRKSGIPQITFTGGEPTLRDDLVELVRHSKWFITRLNTNGVLLTEDLCKALYEASLDSVQITLYSADEQKHNTLVGAAGWSKTVAGLKNALRAGLNASINTPLCTINGDYTETLAFLHGLGVKYVSCSGMIPAGNACKEESKNTQLSPEALYDILKSARQFCREHDMDISFTSPGWIGEAELADIGFASAPTCGACLSNMAVAPDGNVVPCQSWLSGEALGNMLRDPWERIWDGTRCAKLRKESAKMEQKCPLRTESQVKQ